MEGLFAWNWGTLRGAEVLGVGDDGVGADDAGLGAMATRAFDACVGAVGLVEAVSWWRSEAAFGPVSLLLLLVVGDFVDALEAWVTGGFWKYSKFEYKYKQEVNIKHKSHSVLQVSRAVENY